MRVRPVALPPVPAQSGPVQPAFVLSVLVSLALVLFALVRVPEVVAQTLHAQTLHLVGDAAYAPYSYNYGGENRGIDVEVVEELGSRLDLDIRLELVARPEMLRMLREGRCDGVLSLRPTEENRELALLLRKHPLHVSTFSAFLHRARRFPVRSLEDLKGRSVALLEETNLGGKFKAMVRSGEIEVMEYPSNSRAVGALLRGQVEAFIGQTRAVHDLLDKGGMSGTVLAEGKPLFKRGGEYLGLSRRSAYHGKEELLKLMELAMADIIADGTYRRIVHRYVL